MSYLYFCNLLKRFLNIILLYNVCLLLLTTKCYMDFRIMLFLVTTKLNSASSRQSPAESSPTPSPASPPEDNTNKPPTTT